MRHFVLLQFLLQLFTEHGKVSSYSTSKTTSTLRLKKDQFLLRPYSSARDYFNLKEMCKDVYGGTDDLPTKAQSLQDDLSCEFLVLEDPANGALVASGNLRRMGHGEEESCYFIEAIRVSPQYEGMGICTLLMRELVHRAKSQHKALEILSCTIDSNEAMKRVFSKPGINMVPVNGFRNPNWELFSGLPGWKASSFEAQNPQNILKALNLEHLVSDASRNVGVWDSIGTYDELKEILEKLAMIGGTIGHLPTVGKPMALCGNLRDSLQQGLVRKLRKPRNNDPSAVFALVKNEEIPCGLKSKHVCSIVATNQMDFDAALWEACSNKYGLLMGGIASFPCVFEQPHPPAPFEAGSLQASLPVQSGKVFINYRWMNNSETRRK